MNPNEVDVRNMIEHLKLLPDDFQERIGYAIMGAAIVAGNYSTQSEPSNQNSA